MKNSEREQDRKFRQQLHHLHSFIAIVPGNGYKPSPSQIREHDRALLIQQANEIEIKSDKSRLMMRLLNFFKKITSIVVRLLTKVSVINAIKQRT